MVRTLKYILCIFLTSGFAVIAHSASTNYCFENSNTNGVMPLQICFKELRMMRLGSEDQRVYIRNQTIDDLFAIQRIEVTNKGTFVTVQGDYLNYVKTCGVTILSKFELRFVLDGNNRYVHDSRNSLVIKYQYTPNNCQDKARPGVETFKTIL